MPRKKELIKTQALGKIAAELMREQPGDAAGELRQQNSELLLSLQDLRRQREELAHLNQELQDTNRGVVALYAELDERAEHLRRADELKTRFLSNMSHEFRTPLNSILALTRFLLDGTDGKLGDEQIKQVGFIRKSAENLSELVNDLLDLAKVEAGKTVMRPSEFSVQSLFGALRGMLRPLLAGDAVSLVFEEATDIPVLTTDEAKVSQILRNFISNALKFTEQGEVKVTAAYAAATDTITFSVSDTGIGIAPHNHDAIFQEFTQVENRLQHKYKGTGLGLPLSKRLAELLGRWHQACKRDWSRFNVFAGRSPALPGAGQPAGCADGRAPRAEPHDDRRPRRQCGGPGRAANHAARIVLSARCNALDWGGKTGGDAASAARPHPGCDGWR